MDIAYGKYLTGWGLLYRIADIWWGIKPDDTPMALLENVESNKFGWVEMRFIRQYYEEVDYAG